MAKGESQMNKKTSKWKQLMAIRGMGAALTAFVGLIIIYVAFGLIKPRSSPPATCSTCCAP